MAKSLVYKIADQAWEFDLIRKLNYETFVEEIPQHQPNQLRQLNDKFDDQNTYIICLDADQLLAMLAVRDKRPFSLDNKLPDLDKFLPKANSICEIRLLAVNKNKRYSKIFLGLLSVAAKYCEKQNYDLAVISATLRQLKLYKNIGFKKFGPVVGTTQAPYQPMFLTFNSYLNSLKPRIYPDIVLPPEPSNNLNDTAFPQSFAQPSRLTSDKNGPLNPPETVPICSLDRFTKKLTRLSQPIRKFADAANHQNFQNSPFSSSVSKLSAILARKTLFNDTNSFVNLLPGPVHIKPTLYHVFAKTTYSHRSEKFMAVHKRTRSLLCRLVNAQNVQIFTGSGTLANEVIAAQLSLLNAKGIILQNGHFGQRIVKQAARFNLNFHTFNADWATPFDYQKLESILQHEPNIRWLWAVHCETSTGMLNDLDKLKSICRRTNTLLCVDCISSVGNTNVDLDRVHLASAVSGKGIASFPGLAFVFYDYLDNQNSSLPTYLDLQHYINNQGVPFTVCSNMLAALNYALTSNNYQKKIQNVAQISNFLAEKLTQIGLVPIVDQNDSCTFVLTYEIPPELSSQTIGDQLEKLRFLVSYKSQYLLERNLIQLCLMTEPPKQRLNDLVTFFENLLLKQKTLSAGAAG